MQKILIILFLAIFVVFGKDIINKNSKTDSIDYVGQLLSDTNGMGKSIIREEYLDYSLDAGIEIDKVIKGILLDSQEIIITIGINRNGKIINVRKDSGQINKKIEEILINKIKKVRLRKFEEHILTNELKLQFKIKKQIVETTIQNKIKSN
jgi:hypothetical protein